MAWRAAVALGIPCRLVKAHEISHARLLGKAKGNAKNADVLLVPGGSARLKATALGPEGMEEIRRWVLAGGSYIGFCGGAGLALANAASSLSLGICPWGRRPYASLSEHHISGHVLVTLEGEGKSPLAVRAPVTAGIERCLPVWWPGRFACQPDDDVHVLARYDAPMPDLWIGDEPICESQCGAARGSGIAHLRNEPILVHGRFGKGAYILSYAHLESPASKFANMWLGQILGELGFACAVNGPVPEWETSLPPGGSSVKNLHRTQLSSFTEDFRRLIALAERENIFSRRKAWLLGWRSGQPGAVCNNLMAALATLHELTPNDSMEDCWQKNKSIFLQLGESFICNAEKYFRRAASDVWAVTGVMSLSQARERDRIFGSPMTGGGLAEGLLDILEELIWLGCGGNCSAGPGRS